MQNVHPLLGPSMELAGQAATAFAQGRANKSTRKWNEKMYERQRADALADWQRQTEYNSPRAQMQRFQEAGLNPNLIYGQTNEAAPVRSTDVKTWSPQAPQFNGGSILGSYYDVQQRKAQVDLLEKQNTIAIQTAALQAAKTGETLAKTAKSQFDLQMANSLKNTSLQTAEENLRKLQIGNQFQLDENERREALTAGNLAQAAERILLMRAQTANTNEQRAQIREQIRSIRLDGDLKQLDKDLRDKGIYPNSPWWLKTLETYLETQTSGKPFGGDLEFIPKSPSTGKPGETGWPKTIRSWKKW